MQALVVHGVRHPLDHHDAEAADRPLLRGKRRVGIGVRQRVVRRAVVGKCKPDPGGIAHQLDVHLEAGGPGVLDDVGADLVEDDVEHGEDGLLVRVAQALVQERRGRGDALLHGGERAHEPLRARDVPHRKDRQVVSLRGVVGERGDRHAHDVAERLGARILDGVDCVRKPFLAEERAAGVQRLGDAVGVEEEPLAGLQRKRARAVLGAFQKRQHRPGPVHDVVRLPVRDLQRRVVPGVGVGHPPALQVEHAAPRREEHVGGVAAAELGVHPREGVGGVAGGEDRVLQQRLRRHHVERGGHALAAHVGDHEGEMGQVEHEEVVEVAADVPRWRHRRRQLEMGAGLERRRQGRALDCLGDLHLLRPGVVLGAVEGPDALGVAGYPREGEGKTAEDQGQQHRHRGGDHVARAVELGLWLDDKEAVAAEGETAVEDALPEQQLRSRPAVAGRAGAALTADVFRDLVLVEPDCGERLRGGFPPQGRDELARRLVRAEEARGVADLGVEEEGKLPRDHPRHARLVKPDLDIPVSAGERHAEVLAAGIAVGVAPKRLRDDARHAVRQDGERARLALRVHVHAEAVRVVRRDDAARAVDNAQLVDVERLGHGRHLLHRTPLRLLEMAHGHRRQVLQHRVYRAVQRDADVVDRVVQHGLGLLPRLARADAPGHAHQHDIQHGGRRRYEAFLHASTAKTELRPVISSTPSTIALGWTIFIVPPAAAIALCAAMRTRSPADEMYSSPLKSNTASLTPSNFSSDSSSGEVLVSSRPATLSVSRPPSLDFSMFIVPP